MHASRAFGSILAAFVWLAPASPAPAQNGVLPAAMVVAFMPRVADLEGRLSELHQAVLRYTRPSLPRLRQEEDGREVYPLHWAALTDQAAVVASLLDRGADANSRDPEGRTPLMVAVAFDSRAVAEVLLARGADSQARDRVHGSTALDFAAMAGRAEIAAQLLAHGADVNSRSPEFGETPLHYAAIYGQRAMIEFLVSSGADVNAGDYNGVRPVQYARIRRQGLAVDALMRIGARPDNLLDAVNAGDVAHVQLLLARGAKVNERDLFGTPLHIAAATGQVWIAAMLLDAGAHLEMTGEPASARALHLAALGNQSAAADLLIERGADVDPRDAQGRTPLAIAAAYGHAKAAAVLLRAGADPNAEEIYRDKPLHYAALSGDLETVQLLLSSGADVNVRNGDSGETPLNYAACQGNLEMVAFLLESGADPNLRDNRGRTTLQAARMSAKSVSVVELLTRVAAHQ